MPDAQPDTVPSPAATARRALALLDLTDLSDTASEAGLLALCKAAGPPGPVAAVCVWPAFVKIARARLKATPVKVATVANFPDGDGAPIRVLSDMEGMTADGAHEIDLVLPYRAFLDGDEEGAATLVREARAVLPETVLLKVILETGAFPDQARIARAAELAIAAGADFLKTSTGKIAVSATPDAVETLLHVARAADRPIGVKVSGGVRTVADAAAYLALVDRVMGPGWAGPHSFRFGASSLHAALLAAIAGDAREDAKADY